jgi:ornithine cyclodeaminase/alanine dehydrogenase-like protein (mu-crystallin family)
MIILNESEIRELVDADSARAVVKDAFRALQRGEATLANVISLPFIEPTGAAHIKAGHLHDDAVWTVKVSGDFYLGDGSGTRHSGLMLVLSATDGSPVAVLVDNGYLTELRTGAAGAIAAELLAREDADTVAVIGPGARRDTSWMPCSRCGRSRRSTSHLVRPKVRTPSSERSRGPTG